jgi:hypothetical protein
MAGIIVREGGARFNRGKWGGTPTRYKTGPSLLSNLIVLFFQFDLRKRILKFLWTERLQT